MLKDTESLFTANVEALDFDYLPKVVPFREGEQRAIANAIKPIFQKRNGRNVFVHGKPGIGKTVAVRHLLREIEDESDELFPIYINCWQKNTSYKVFLALCESLGYKFTQNKKTEELSSVVTSIINKNMGAVIVFDEIDKAEDLDFLYTLLEEVYRKTIVLITNYQSWLAGLDERIRSRLLPDIVEFLPYNERETIEILRQRMKFAFVPDVWKEDAFMQLAKVTAEKGDVRSGLYLLKTAGQLAEDKSKKEIGAEDAKEALDKLDAYSINDTGELIDVEKEILELVKKHSGKKIGELFKIYEKGGSSGSYKTFQRKIKKLEDGKYISVKKLEGGKEGTTSIVTYGQKTLGDF